MTSHQTMENIRMLYGSSSDRSRRDYIVVKECCDGSVVSTSFHPDKKPLILWDHVDGPLLCLRDGQVHWLTWRERFRCWIGRDDAETLEQRIAPDFVRRWNEKLRQREKVT